MAVPCWRRGPPSFLLPAPAIDGSSNSPRLPGFSVHLSSDALDQLLPQATIRVLAVRCRLSQGEPAAQPGTARDTTRGASPTACFAALRCPSSARAHRTGTRSPKPWGTGLPACRSPGLDCRHLTGMPTSGACEVSGPPTRPGALSATPPPEPVRGPHLFPPSLHLHGGAQFHPQFHPTPPARNQTRHHSDETGHGLVKTSPGITHLPKTVGQ